MSLVGRSTRLIYSGAVDSDTAQSDPGASLGGLRPDNGSAADSEIYNQGTLDSQRSSPVEIQDTETDGDPEDAAVDDWVTIVEGVAGGSYARVVAVDTGTGVITLDRPLPGLPDTPDRFRVCKRENLFPDATVAQVQSGVVDHRMIYLLKTNVGNEDNFRFWIEPIQPNGCDLEIAAAGVDIDDNPVGDVGVDLLLADAEDSPFLAFGKIDSGDAGFDGMTPPTIAYSEDSAVPYVGSDAITDEACLAIWIRRTIPANSAPGHCAFAIHIVVPDAVSQDPSANPDPFDIPVIVAWDNPVPSYALAISVDRKLYTRGQARVIGTVTYPDGSPAEGLNARIEQTAGDGTTAADLDARTDSQGQVTAIYTAPAAVGTDPTFRLSVPTASGV